MDQETDEQVTVYQVVLEVLQNIRETDGCAFGISIECYHGVGLISVVSGQHELPPAPVLRSWVQHDGLRCVVASTTDLLVLVAPAPPCPSGPASGPSLAPCVAVIAKKVTSAMTSSNLRVCIEHDGVARTPMPMSTAT